MTASIYILVSFVYNIVKRKRDLNGKDRLQPEI
jgi:hypothetical protein